MARKYTLNSDDDERRKKFALDNWKAQPESPVSDDTVHPIERQLLTGIAESQRIQIRYSGGTSPGENRWIRPRRVYDKGHSTYVDAYCESRQSERCFHLDRLAILKVEGQAAEPARPSPSPAASSSPPPTASIQRPETSRPAKPASKGGGCLVLFLGVSALMTLLNVISALSR